ncbi:unnamed protein product [Rotaria sordida]|uniref:Ubiquitin-like domain-containing protein n=1 Tax=Rotaria sordida TaxID=392033 RepID=A0A813N192_9BILA|nr:unnamed protein product [Rotaria sordida]CAF0847729.1 unnamed protein product [Rotaria sordida]CAF0892773.1 unnamed protein product [Rotaria sordida]CAF0893657.1 unnamed protein product [Rotaria sordida]CAF0953745.1 unnamed protein product [Rotaria sordida]
MQSLPSTSNTYHDCYLQIRRAKQTIFTDVAEATTVYELKQIMGNILRIDPNIIRLSVSGQIFDTDSKQLVEYGITTKEARPQNPFQLEFTLKLDDDSYENIEIVPYTTQTSSSNDES